MVPKQPSLASLRVRSLEICALAEPAACVLAGKCLCTWGVRTTSHRPASPLVASGASLPSPVLLRQHLRALLKAAAAQCPSLSYGLVGEALGLLMKTYDETSHLKPLARLEVLQILQVGAPWFVNVTLWLRNKTVACFH